jgi:hypothetical protein
VKILERFAEMSEYSGDVVPIKGADPIVASSSVGPANIHRPTASRSDDHPQGREAMSVLKRGIVLATLGLSMMTVGCQTWIPEAGVTLPSEEWLIHPPQFFPPTPQFPLPRELNTMQNYKPQAPNPPG